MAVGGDRASAGGSALLRSVSLRSSASRWRCSEDACGTVCAATACLAPLVASMSLGFTSPALDTMRGRSTTGMVPTELRVFADAEGQAASLFSSLVNVGALLGALSGGRLCKRVGRGNTIRAAAVLMGACWWWVALTSSAMHLCVARVAMGLGVGLQSVATPTYIAEVSPPKIRGALGTMNAAAILVGVMVVDFAGGSIFRAGINRELCAWRSLACFVAVSAMLLLGASAVLPERSLRRSLPLQAANGEWSVSSPSSSATTDDLPGRRVFLAGLIPLVWQQLSGVNAVIFFGQSILSTAGVQGANILGVAVIAVQLVGVLFAACLIDRAGRRPLLIGSCLGMALGAGALAVCLAFRHPPGVAVVAALCLYVLSFSLGLGPIPWLLPAELDRRVRVQLASIATAANWACSFAVTGPPLEVLQRAFGLSGSFAVFSGICLVGTVLIALLVPETKPGQFFPFSPRGGQFRLTIES